MIGNRRGRFHRIVATMWDPGGPVGVTPAIDLALRGGRPALDQIRSRFNCGPAKQKEACAVAHQRAGIT
jgi:hypothetical protein